MSIQGFGSPGFPRGKHIKYELEAGSVSPEIDQTGAPAPDVYTPSEPEVVFSTDGWHRVWRPDATVEQECGLENPADYVPSSAIRPQGFGRGLPPGFHFIRRPDK